MDDDLYHVMPIGDLREHVADGLTCWCHPQLHDDDDNVIVHNSMDGREQFETGERKPS